MKTIYNNNQYKKYILTNDNNTEIIIRTKYNYFIIINNL